MNLDFTKMHGLGNDFVVVDDRDLHFDFEPDAIEWLCDRHFGVGADGLILVRPADVEDADFRMLYYNADGTEAEMCGNGIRVFAKFLIDTGVVPAGTGALRVQTGAGVLAVECELDAEGLMSQATVDMGEPILRPSLVPTTLGADAPEEPVIGGRVETASGDYLVTCVSMGNPHAIIWVDDVDEAPVAEIGSLIEVHPAFPRKTNVEFAQFVPDESRIRLRVWERGVGETLACGTGACATVVAASLEGLVDRQAEVELLGGSLAVRWSEDGRVRMTGPAQTVFSGTLDLGDDEQ